jgi:hypothetical protein
MFESSNEIMLKEEFDKCLNFIQSLISDKADDIKKFIKIIKTEPKDFPSFDEISINEKLLGRIIQEIELMLSEDSASEGQNIQKKDDQMKILKNLEIIISENYAYNSKISFFRGILNSPNAEHIFFRDIYRSQENILKRFKELTLITHPDKTHWIK